MVQMTLNKRAEKLADEKNAYFAHEIISNPFGLMRWLELKGHEGDDVYPYDNGYGTVGVAVSTYDTVHIDDEDVVYETVELLPFDKKDWKCFNEFRNKLINELLFCGKQ